jgi:hypothetical protein
MVNTALLAPMPRTSAVIAHDRERPILLEAPQRETDVLENVGHVVHSYSTRRTMTWTQVQRVQVYRDSINPRAGHAYPKSGMLSQSPSDRGIELPTDAQSEDLATGRRPQPKRCRVLANQLTAVSPHDPLTLGGVIGLPVIVGLAACYFPAHHAARVDPLAAMRIEQRTTLPAAAAVLQLLDVNSMTWGPPLSGPRRASAPERCCA